jgi:hypothetical protein
MKKWLYYDPLGVTREFNLIEDFPLNTVGFIYKITNLVNAKFYIGRKVLFNNTNKVLEISSKQSPILQTDITGFIKPWARVLYQASD